MSKNPEEEEEKQEENQYDRIRRERKEVTDAEKQRQGDINCRDKKMLGDDLMESFRRAG